MNTKTRLALMFGLLVLIFGGTVFGLRVWYAREAARMMGKLESERRQLLGEVLQLAAQPLRTFARDYSNWDEMLAFVHSGDEAWAPINIDASLQTFNVHAAWVLRADGSLVYGATRQLNAGHRVPPFPVPLVLARLRREKFPNFFVELPEGLLEICAAPIQPSSDVRRDTEPQGWLLIGRLWDSPYVNVLGRVLAGAVSLVRPGHVPAVQREAHLIDLEEDLLGWDGSPLQQLHLTYRPASLADTLDNDRYDLIIFCSFGLLFIACTSVAVSLWVIKPLRQLEQSLTAHSPSPLAQLINQPDEFGRLARLATSSLAHQAALEREIDERKRVETALRQSEQQVRLSAELRTRLARDLHDNVIQSIYATGLGLESVRRSLRSDPATAEQHLEAVGSTLNQLIREIRSFISGLEPEHATVPAQFAQALQTLAHTLQALHPIRIDLDLDPLAGARLTAQEEMHTLQIVREGVSNALRHGAATRIELRLIDDDGVTVLHLEDNGGGFNPATVSGKGSGLNNQAARAKEMGAQFRLDSAPGKGTCITLRFDRTPRP